VVPHTRGRERSRPAKTIIQEIKKLINHGCQEIILLGQNVNSYRCGQIDFVKLLRKIVSLPGKFQIKFLTNHPKDVSDKLIDLVAGSKKIAKEIHLPVQSGDNQILKKMNRAYTIENYKRLVRKIRKKIPDVQLSTDVIVGFPGETKKQFQNTIKLLEEIGFSHIYASAYSPRPGTAAVKLKDTISSGEKKIRKRIILGIIKQQQKTRLEKPLLVVILGTNASGKSSLAIKLAKKFNGEIVSADSRQIYKNLDIGSGKVTKTEQKIVPHHLLDITKPNTSFTLAQYQKLAFEAIDDIITRNKIPFLVGGTGLYIQAVCENLDIPRVKPDKKLRKKLEKLSLQELQEKYRKIDKQGYGKIDTKNPRRLIRAIEVVKTTGQSFWKQRQKKQPQYNYLKLGLTHPQKILEQRIKKRTEKRLQKGWVKEVEKLIKNGVSQKWFIHLGLGYSHIIQFLKNKTTKEELKRAISKDELAYAKKQITWFKKDKEIHWTKNQKQAEKLIKKFLTKT